MQKIKTIAVVSLLFILGAGLNGCAVFPKCTPENCASDKQINAEVRKLFGQHAELGAPAELHIQTINGVVYMNGAVNSEFEVRQAEALAREVANVKEVNNNLYPRSNSR
jgi:osmotically-inducible protein OsmY